MPQWNMSQSNKQNQRFLKDTYIYIYIYIYTKKKKWKWKWSRSVSNSLQPHDCSLPRSSIHGILQARVLEWVAIYFFRGSSWPRSNPGLPHCRQTLYRLNHQGSPFKKKGYHKRLSFLLWWELKSSLWITIETKQNISQNLMPVLTDPYPIVRLRDVTILKAQTLSVGWWTSRQQL